MITLNGGGGGGGGMGIWSAMVGFRFLRMTSVIMVRKANINPTFQKYISRNTAKVISEYSVILVFFLMS